MKRTVARLGSPKVTAALMLPLLATVFAINQIDSFSSNWVAIPLSLLAVNLLSAVFTNASFRRQPALLAFHICLFLTISLTGFGVLVQYDGHVELVEGEAFDASRVELTERGLFRRGGPESIEFEQGRIAIDYAPGLIRQSTLSDVTINGKDGDTNATRLGDQVSLNLDGYRFSTSFNKGFAAVLEWTGDSGDVLLGAINFPSYPEYEWKQLNGWTTPSGEQLQLELLLPNAANRTRSWRLQSSNSNFSLIVSRPGHGDARLARGESLSLRGGRLTAVELRLWMGYRVDSNPLLPWVFVAALASILMLALHFNSKYWRGAQPHGALAGGPQSVRIGGN
jgi:cytochrome c biogenesis protein